MKRRTLICVMILGAFLPVMATRVVAQDKELVADIPFNFTVCTQQMPAGKYRVRPLTRATTNVLLVHSEDNQSAEIACTHDIQSSTPMSGGKLIFNRYGSQYFLSELWFSGETTGHQLSKSEREEAVIKELSPKVKRGRVTVKVTEVKPD